MCSCEQQCKMICDLQCDQLNVFFQGNHCLSTKVLRLQRAQSTPMCNVQSMSLQTNTEASKQQQECSADRKASLFPPTADGAAHSAALWCPRGDLEERDLEYIQCQWRGQRIGSRVVCRDIQAPLKPWSPPWNYPHWRQFWKWHFLNSTHYKPNQDPGISSCSINVSDWLIKTITLFRCNWFQSWRGNMLRSNPKDLTKQPFTLTF